MNPDTIALPPTPAPAPACGLRSLQRLRDWVPVRRLHQGHRALVRTHLLRLDATDRQRRFGHALSDERLHTYAAQLDFERDQIFGTFDRRLQLVALGHLALGNSADTQAATDSDATDSDAMGSDAMGSDATAAGHGELGVSVLPQVRGRGLGTRLFEHAVTQARNRGVHTLHVQLARDNAPMLAIVARAGAQITLHGDDAVAVLSLAGETLGSQLDELLGAHAAALDFRLKVQTWRLPTPRHGPLSPPFG